MQRIATPRFSLLSDQMHFKFYNAPQQDKIEIEFSWKGKIFSYFIQGCSQAKLICMFAVAQPSLLNSTDSEFFFAQIYKN